MSDLKSHIMNDIKVAMKAKEMQKLGTLRMLTAAIKQREVDERIELDDASILAVVEKMIKQRKDAATQYQDAGREELAEKEIFEISILSQYLPLPLSPEELDALITSAISESGAESMRDMGKVMAVLKDKAQGRADMSEVSQIIKSKLS